MQWIECKYTGEFFFMCLDCGGMWRDLNSALNWKETGGQNGPNASLDDYDYLEFVGRPKHFLDDPNYENWTDDAKKRCQASSAKPLLCFPCSLLSNPSTTVKTTDENDF